MSAITHLHQRPRCTNDNTPAGDNDAASTRIRRSLQKSSTDGNGNARPHPTNISRSSSRFKRGKQMNGIFQNHERDLWTSHQGDQPRRDSATWNVVDDQTVATSRTLHAVRATCGIIRRTGSGISDIDRNGTIGGHPACIATKGATRDEEQEEQRSEPPGGPVGAWQSLTERQPGNSVEEGPERLRPSTECDPEGRQRGDLQRTMRALRESVAAHSSDHGGAGFEDDAKQSHSALVNRETACRDRTSLLSTVTWEHDDAAHATAESPLGMLDVQCNIRAQPGRVRCAPSGPVELRNMVPIGEDETQCL